VKHTIWLLWDHLHHDHSILAAASPRTHRIIMIESRSAGARLRYHTHRLTLLYSAMRHRAEELRAQGWHVDYHPLSDKKNAAAEALAAHTKKYRTESFHLIEPTDYPMRQAVTLLAKKISTPIHTHPDDLFLCSREEFARFAKNKKRLLMEHHYRAMRKKLGLLMTPDGQPEGGAWNFDHDNRAGIREFVRAGSPQAPPPPWCAPDAITRSVIAEVKKYFPAHPGDPATFRLPVTRQRALDWLNHFIRHRLPLFGTYEDLISQKDPLLFHSMLSPFLNCGLLRPLECCQAAIAAHRAGAAPLNAVEGFVRQIIGWREFVNGIYWEKMPGYLDANALQAERPLPRWIYSGDTRMACMHHAILQLQATGYTHHIQRLMVLGNFFLLAEARPPDVLRWYNEMYIDSYDWVMAANVLGMILHADGGYMATKPYAATSAYINKMSDHCAGCHYRHAEKSGPRSCPFNSLFWRFWHKHRDRFSANPRVKALIAGWDKRPAAEKHAVLQTADEHLKNIDTL